MYKKGDKILIRHGETVRVVNFLCVSPINDAEFLYQFNYMLWGNMSYIANLSSIIGRHYSLTPIKRMKFFYFKNDKGGY